MKYIHKNYSVEAFRLPAASDDDITAFDRWAEEVGLKYRVSDGDVVFAADQASKDPSSVVITSGGGWVIAHGAGKFEFLVAHDFESSFREAHIDPPKYLAQAEDQVWPLVLTKENFFDGLFERNPRAMEEFCRWVDRFKMDCDWLVLFADHHYGKELRSPKFHELPLTMQIGPIIQFFHTQFPGKLTGMSIPPTMLGCMAWIETAFTIYDLHLQKVESTEGGGI